MNINFILDFLTDLNQNNNREWFAQNKSRYEQARKYFEEFISALIYKTLPIDDYLTPLEPKDCIFRIFRDVRFSQDKQPYKVNFGASIARGGRKCNFPSYYVHIQPGASFVGGGLYMPPPEILKVLRSGIYANFEEFLTIVKNNDFEKLFPVFDGEKLKTPPRGFPKDFQGIDFLKHKSYSVSIGVDDQTVTGTGYENYVVDVFKKIVPFNRFLTTEIIEET